MEIPAKEPAKELTCDGCGLPASPAHLAERFHRLELATRFRPTHMGILFIAAAPSLALEDDFYAPPKSHIFFDSFLDALDISGTETKSSAEMGSPDAVFAGLVEFQRKGYYLSYLSECPLPENRDSVRDAIARLGPALVLRIRFNYRPKKIAVLGSELSPLADVLRAAGMSATFLPLPDLHRVTDSSQTAQFRAELSRIGHGG